MSDKINPCPKCKSDDVVLGDEGEPTVCVFCLTCGHKGEGVAVGDSQEAADSKAVESWNKQVPEINWQQLAQEAQFSLEIANGAAAKALNERDAWKALAQEAGKALALFRGEHGWHDSDEALVAKLKAEGLEVEG